MTESPPLVENRDSLLHVIARDFRWLLRAVCMLLLLSTAVLMMTFWYAAIATVILLLLCYAVLVVADGVEARTAPTAAAVVQSPRDRSPDEIDPARRSAQDDADRVSHRISRVAIEILVGALVLGAALAFTFFGWELLPAALLVTAGYLVLVSAPMWMAWMEREADGTERTRGGTGV